MSGSFDAVASARNSDSRYGWLFSGARLAALKAISAALECWADKGGSGVSECATILSGRSSWGAE